MKIKSIFIVALALGLITISQPSFSLTLPMNSSLWVQLDPTMAPAPSSFDGLTLFWYWITGELLFYQVYGPVGFGGNIQLDATKANLSPFFNEDVVFEFKSGTQDVEFRDPAEIFGDSTIPGGLPDGPAPTPFYFGFYDGVISGGWENRTVVEYIAGISTTVEPPHGNPWFDQPLNGINPVQQVRSDFQATPEPSSALLLAFGLMALTVFGIKLKKK